MSTACRIDEDNLVTFFCGVFDGFLGDVRGILAVASLEYVDFCPAAFSGDQLYPAVIKEYVENLLESVKNLECFIEGTRSRTGKLLPPKLGILKYIVEGLLNGRTDDVWICPVSVQYDSVIESETYVSELLGKPKEAESLLGLLSGSSSLLQLTASF